MDATAQRINERLKELGDGVPIPKRKRMEEEEKEYVALLIQQRDIWSACAHNLTGYPSTCTICGYQEPGDC